MSLLIQTKSLLKKYKLRPIHHRGQNFLINENILNKIIDVAELKKSDVVLEVGPGLGVLTKKLAERARKVIAVELDKNLVEVLKKELGDLDNVEIIQENILKFNPTNYKLPTTNYKIVANLPYNITSKFIRTFLEAEQKPGEMILMVQKEVAERIVAKPGQMSLLSLSCQFYADCDIEFFVGKKNFLPVPKVDSAVVSLKVKNRLPAGKAGKSKVNEEKLFKIARTGFSSKRKKLIGNLAKGLKMEKVKLEEIFKKVGLKENIRAQELSVDDWIRLSLKIDG